MQAVHEMAQLCETCTTLAPLRETGIPYGEVV
jgi:hypothetical protein